MLRFWTLRKLDVTLLDALIATPTKLGNMTMLQLVAVWYHAIYPTFTALENHRLSRWGYRISLSGRPGPGSAYIYTLLPRCLHSPICSGWPFGLGGRRTWAMDMHAHGHGHALAWAWAAHCGQWSCSLTNHVDLVQTTWTL